MRLILSIAAQSGKGKKRKNHEFNGCRAVVGSADNADLKLDGLAAVSFLVDRDEKGSLALFRKDPKQALTVDGNEVTAERIDLRNGSTLQVGGREILVRVEFEHVGQSSRSGILTLGVAILAALIFVAELSIITWLPRRIEQSELWAKEALRQQTFQKLDNLRSRIRTILASERKSTGQRDTYTAPTAELYKAEADRLALFVRENHSDLSTDQLTRIKQDVDILDGQMALLQQKKLIPPPRQIDSDVALKAILTPDKKEDK